MFTITVNDIERIFQDYGIYEHCAGFSELQRYHDEEDDPDSKEVRLIVKAETNSGSAVVIRFKNEADVTLDTVTAQSKFAVLLAENGIETPRIYHANGQYARWYQISGYNRHGRRLCWRGTEGGRYKNSGANRKTSCKDAQRFGNE